MPPFIVAHLFVSGLILLIEAATKKVLAVDQSTPSAVALAKQDDLMSLRYAQDTASRSEP